MSLQSFKVVAGIAGGILLVLSACGPSSPTTPTALPPAETASFIAEATVVLLSSTVVTPASTPLPPTITPTPLIPPMPIPTPPEQPFTYHTITEGETLSYIAMGYDISLENLMALNNLPDESAIIQTGQLLRVPLQTDNISPNRMLLPDSEVVYSPAYRDFNVADFINHQNGYLAQYRQYVDNTELTGPEIITRIAEQFSVGPRLLLALLEYYGGWVTNPTPSADLIDQPLGPRNPYGSDLYRALGFTANRVNAGYYGYKRDGFWIFNLLDRSEAVTPAGLNAGTVGLQNILAIHADASTWAQALTPTGFMATYQTLFGDPFAHTFEPVVPVTLTQPELSLPWREGDRFYLTGGPHPAYADGSAWAAIDFGPPDVLGNCRYSDVPVTATADGIIVSARQGEVQLDLDGDGLIQTGWGLLYLHVALDVDQPVQAGQRVKTGDVIGYASCEGGLSNSSHLHLARRYNGEWLDAGGPVPMNLSGWVVQPNLTPYAGTITRNGETREACECWDDTLNMLTRD